VAASILSRSRKLPRLVALPRLPRLRRLRLVVQRLHRQRLRLVLRQRLHVQPPRQQRPLAAQRLRRPRLNLSRKLHRKTRVAISQKVISLWTINRLSMMAAVKHRPKSSNRSLLRHPRLLVAHRHHRQQPIAPPRRALGLHAPEQRHRSAPPRLLQHRPVRPRLPVVAHRPRSPWMKKSTCPRKRTTRPRLPRSLTPPMILALVKHRLPSRTLAVDSSPLTFAGRSQPPTHP
jgi:hypothetical protein